MVGSVRIWLEPRLVGPQGHHRTSWWWRFISTLRTGPAQVEIELRGGRGGERRKSRPGGSWSLSISSRLLIARLHQLGLYRAYGRCLFLLYACMFQLKVGKSVVLCIKIVVAVSMPNYRGTDTDIFSWFCLLWSACRTNYAIQCWWTTFYLVCSLEFRTGSWICFQSYKTILSKNFHWLYFWVLCFGKVSTGWLIRFVFVFLDYTNKSTSICYVGELGTEICLHESLILEVLEYWGQCLCFIDLYQVELPNFLV